MARVRGSRKENICVPRSSHILNNGHLTSQLVLKVGNLSYRVLVMSTEV
jgi:hypothetical protein